MNIPFLGFILILNLLLVSCVNDRSVELPVTGKTMMLSEFRSDNEITRFEYNQDSSLSKIFFQKTLYQKIKMLPTPLSNYPIRDWMN